MEFTPALILDIVLAVVFVVTVLSARRQGLASTVVRLIGTFVSLLAAYTVSEKLPPEVFGRFFRSGLIEKTSKLIAENGQITVQNIINKIGGFLPQSLVEELLGGSDKLTELLDASAPNIAEQVVENIIEPLFMPIIGVVLFFAVFALCMAAIRFLTALLVNINHIPLVGGANRLLGTLVGVLLGIMYVIIGLCAVWAVLVVIGYSPQIVENSFFYGIFSQYNPFM